MKNTIGFIFFILTLSSFTLMKGQINNGEKIKHVACYNQGQLVYLESSDKKIDTLQIKYVDSTDRCNGRISLTNDYVYNRFQIEFSSTDSAILSTGDVTFQRLKKGQIESLISTPIKSKEFVFINYKYFWPNIQTKAGTIYKTFLGDLHKDTLKVNDREITNYYLIQSYNFKKKRDKSRIDTRNQIEFIIWTDKEGLTAYKTKQGVWYAKRLN